MKSSATHPKLKEFAKSSASIEATEFSSESLGGPKSNLWSMKARQDIFERRQKGEDWETICKDYPSRTRHAMQQQYSVMKRQNAPDSPRFVSRRRRGRKTRGSARNKWATVNRMHDTSEDEIDSDAGLDNDMDDEEEEEGYESDDNVAEDESHGAEEDLAAENGAPLNHSIRPSALGRSATEPSSHTTIPRRATFPNLPGFAVPLAPNLEPRPSQPESSKRKIETEATDSESRTSSHLSKRRKHSAELSETFNPGSADPPAPMKLLLDNMNQNGMIFYPEAITQAEENYRNLVLAYTAEKTSRQETYEAALKRATRRANDAERKLQDASQNYADQIKASDETHAKAVEAFREEIANLTASLKSSNESLKTATESTSLRTALSEKEAQLARHDELRSQLVSKFESLCKSHIKATETVSALKTQQEKTSKFIDEFFGDWGDVTFNKLKTFASDMKVDTHIMNGLVAEELGEWEKIGNITDWLVKAVAPAADAEKVDAVTEKTTTTPVTTTATATAVAMTEEAPVEQQQQQQQEVSV